MILSSWPCSKRSPRNLDWSFFDKQPWPSSPSFHQREGGELSREWCGTCIDTTAVPPPSSALPFARCWPCAGLAKMRVIRSETSGRGHQNVIFCPFHFGRLEEQLTMKPWPPPSFLPARLLSFHHIRGIKARGSGEELDG